jgi:aspartate aminotransferase-like enzyme
MNYVMISEKINLSTGPVSISMEVQNALIEPSISHRSDEFKRLLSHTTDLVPFSNAYTPVFTI